MELFLDSAKIEEIKQIKDIGLLDGVTTNPSLIKKAIGNKKNISIEDYIKKILKICGKRPVSLEVIGNDFDDMVKEGLLIYKKFNKFGNVFVKIPVNPCMDNKCSKDADGIKAIRYLSNKKIPINCTLIFTPEQALLATKAGAKIVSPFVGREDDYIRTINNIKFNKEDYFPEKGWKKGRKILDDNGIVSGVGLIKECVKILKGYEVKILAASIRNVRQFREVAESGADIATLPFNVIKELLVHDKTKEGMRNFTKDIIPSYAKILRDGKRKK